MFAGQKPEYYDGMITIKHGHKYSNKMKQTAVEQLQEYLSISLGPDRMRLLFNEFEKAKKMEKNYLCYFYVKGAEAEINNPYVSNIEFYNETFKSE